MLSKEVLEELKNEYTPGSVVELVKMDDPYTHIPVGTKGVVRYVDDAGTIHCSWKTGSSLGVVYGEDEVKMICRAPLYGGNIEAVLDAQRKYGLLRNGDER